MLSFTDVHPESIQNELVPGIGVFNPEEQTNAYNTAEEQSNADLIPRKSRKRIRNPEAKKRSKAKKSRNCGEPYIDYKGRQIEGKNFFNTICNCKLKCNNSIIEDERKTLFDNFNSIGDYGKQNAYLCGLVHEVPVLTRRPRDNTRGERSCSSNITLKNPEKLFKSARNSFLILLLFLMEG